MDKMLGFHGTHARLAFFTPQAQWSREQPLHVVLCFLLRSRSLWRGTIGRSAAAPPRRSRQASGPARAQPAPRRAAAQPPVRRAIRAAGGALRRARVVQRHDRRKAVAYAAPRRPGVLSIGRGHSARAVVRLAEAFVSSFARPWPWANCPHVRATESAEATASKVAVVESDAGARKIRPVDAETAVVVRAIHGHMLSHWRAIRLVSQC